MEEYKDGMFLGRAKSIGGELDVMVTIEQGQLVDVQLPVNKEHTGIGKEVAEALAEQILEKGTTEGVDAMSGATFTSNAVFEAADRALKCATTGYNDGKYKGSAQSIGGTIDEIVTVENGDITDITFELNNEHKGIGKEAAPIIAQSIIDANSTNVDTIAGATRTSEAVIKATQMCLDQASGEAMRALQEQTDEK